MLEDNLKCYTVFGHQARNNLIFFSHQCFRRQPILCLWNAVLINND
jgi:hypothetical protein